MTLPENLPAMRETRVRSLGWEDPLEKEIATHCSILAWEITWTEEPARLQSMGSQRVSHDLAQQQQYNECMRSEPPGGPWLSNFFISYFIICVSSIKSFVEQVKEITNQRNHKQVKMSSTPHPSTSPISSFDPSPYTHTLACCCCC